MRCNASKYKWTWSWPFIVAEYQIEWCLMGAGWWIRLIVGCQPLMVISPTASWIRWCMHVYAWWFNVDLSCLGQTIYARQFWVPSHRFNSATGEQKGINETIYTDSEPPSRMPNSLMPSAKLRSANLPFLRLWCDAVRDRTPASRTPSRRSNHNDTRGR